MSLARGSFEAWYGSNASGKGFDMPSDVQIVGFRHRRLATGRTVERPLVLLCVVTAEQRDPGTS